MYQRKEVECSYLEQPEKGLKGDLRECLVGFLGGQGPRLYSS